MPQEKAIPPAYFITFTCYGTWLHGEKSTSVDRSCNIPGSNFLSYAPKRASLVKASMTEKPYLLDSLRRGLVLSSIKSVCKHQQWVLLAAHVRTNHIHLVIHAIIEPEKIMNTLKAYASRFLNEAKLDENRKNRWTHHGSTRYLWKEKEIEATIRYVVDEQGTPMAVFENKEREFLHLFKPSNY